MTPSVKIHVVTDIELSIETAAQWFWNISDEEQSQFFVEVAKLADAEGSLRRDTQWLYVGGHLGKCECSSDGARNMLRTIVEEMNKKDPEYATP